MRDTLIFSGFPEEQDETEQQTKTKLITLMKQNLTMEEDIVDQIKFKEVRRLGQQKFGQHRKIIAKFENVVDREKVRTLRDTLKHTDAFIHELYPKDVVDQRKRLIPHMLRARQDGKEAWLSYNKLYVNRELVTCYPPDSASGSAIDTASQPLRDGRN